MITAFCLYLPMFLWIVYRADEISPRHVAAVGAVNLLVGVSLLALISEKWTRQLK